MKKLILVITVILFSTPVFSQQPLKVVYFHNFPPFSWEEEGEMKGIFIDVLNEVIAKNMGIPISHKGYPWARAQMYVEHGEADAFVTVPTPKRRIYTKMSNESIIVSKTSIFSKKGHPRIEEMKSIKTIEDFRKFRLITYIGDGYSKKLFPDWENVMWKPTLDNCLKLLKGRGPEIFVQSSEVTNFRIKALGYQGQFVELPSPVKALPFHLCIGNKSSYLNVLSKFDKVLKKMKKRGGIKEIIYNYR